MAVTTKTATGIDGERMNAAYQPGSYGISRWLIGRRNRLRKTSVTLLLALSRARALPRCYPHVYSRSEATPSRRTQRPRIDLNKNPASKPSTGGWGIRMATNLRPQSADPQTTLTTTRSGRRSSIRGGVAGDRMDDGDARPHCAPLRPPFPGASIPRASSV